MLATQSPFGTAGKRMDYINLTTGKLNCSKPSENGVRSFKGMPFAAPPVGLLRFAPPQSCPAWTGVRPSDKFGNNSLQKVIFGDIDPFVDGVSEDCLYLNVWTEADLQAQEKRPVLFWIHGGGFVVGSGSEPRYDGTKLAERGVVVVTVNHRLNALGYLAHPALTAEQGSSGNYAMLDLVAALQWVKANIAAFGGDAARVTIAGESAGSMACSVLMCSPLAKGLFAGVIGQSGALLATPAEPLMTLAEAESHGLAFAQKMGAKSASDLRGVAASRILDAAPGLGFRPIIDGYLLPENPADIFNKGLQHDVPMLAGWNKDEGFNFDVSKWGNGKNGVAHWLKIPFGDKASQAIDYYPYGSDAQAAQSARDLGGDLIINHGAWAWIEAQRARGVSPLFRYCFDHAPVTQPGFFPVDAVHPGAFHSCELPYVFEVPGALGWEVRDVDIAVARMTANYWVNFITSGDPNGDGLKVWSSYRNAERPCLRISATCSLDADIDGERHRVLSKLMQK
jgi:para-nitrobenzyl esterase